VRAVQVVRTLRSIMVTVRVRMWINDKEIQLAPKIRSMLESAALSTKEGKKAKRADRHF